MCRVSSKLISLISSNKQIKEVQIGVPHISLRGVEECIYNSYKMGIVSVLRGIQSSVFVKKKKKLQLHSCSILYLFEQKDVMSSSFANWYTPSLISGMFPGTYTSIGGRHSEERYVL